nr:hypothetical protein B456_001G162300 [Ipomoea trifida]
MEESASFVNVNGEEEATSYSVDLTAHNGDIVGSNPTKPTTPFSSLDTKQSKYPSTCRSKSSDGICNHIVAAALRARLLSLSLTYALAACPLGAIRCNTRCIRAIALRSLYSCDSEGSKSDSET